MNYLEHISIKPFIQNGQATTLDSSECQRFNDFICEHYPWIEISQSRIDWNKIAEKKQIKWGHDSTDKEVREFIEKSFISKYDEVCFVFTASDPGIIVPYEVMKEEFFVLISPSLSQSICFIVGIKRDSCNIPLLVPEDFMEVGAFTEWLSYSLKRKG